MLGALTWERSSFTSCSDPLMRMDDRELGVSDLYHRAEYVDQAIDRLAPFYAEHLGGKVGLVSLRASR